ncbi:MAG: oxidoreductase, molybdopterin binding [Dehalococcoidia bacterium]|nr:oxidoreductase, molybdopterin binding [Dehalococcoidia bacterium]
MLPGIGSSAITPERLYVSRREFLIATGALAATTLFLGGCRQPGPTSGPGGTDFCQSAQASKPTDELGDSLTVCDSIINYNNFYEFSTEKEDVADLARDFKTSPWTVQVGGLVNKPKTFDLDDLRQRFPQEERIYRMRCVEAWSMVIPWLGFPLASLLKEVEPASKAKYVRFEALYDTKQLPGQRRGLFKWPYVEGLRLDEAMNDLTILATGIYGKPLPPQNGAPIRLVAPWKYGFKNIKSVVKIDLVEEIPVSLWMAASPDEYGFYANVSPSTGMPGRRRTSMPAWT